MGRLTLVLAALTSGAAMVGAFLVPASCPASRGSALKMAEAMSIQAGGTVRASNLDLKGMNFKLGSEALKEFQDKRKGLLVIGEGKEPVEYTMKRFNNLYGRPVIPFYRTTLYELVQTAHLAVTDSSFVYTHFFAYGFLYAFETVFKGYPVPNEWVALFEAAATSAQLDPEKIRKDSEVLKQYMASGKTQDDFLRALESPGDNEIEKEIQMIAKAKAFLPERYFSFGFCKLMESMGVEVNWDSIKTWCEKLSMDETRTQLDWDLLERSMKKLGELELLMKQVEIREKKRLAERLEEKAKKAAELAANALASSSSSSGSTAGSSEPQRENKDKAPAMST